MLVDIDDVSNKLVTNINLLNKNDNNYKNDVPEEEIEGFFGGLSDWLYSKVGSDSASANQNLATPTNNLNPSPDSLKAANSSENSIPQLNSKFPNQNINDSSNEDLLNSINKKKDEIKKITSQKFNKNDGLDKLKNMNAQLKKSLEGKKNPDFSVQDEEQKKLNVGMNSKILNNTNKKVLPTDNNILNNQEVNKPVEKIIKNVIKPSPTSMFKDCNFYSDKCPKDYNDFGSIGLSGIDKNVMLSCGNVENTKPAKAIAKIKNNALEEVIVIDKGHGFNPNKPPKIDVVGGKGNGAHCESVIDDDGFLSLIKIIHPGNYYTETPNIIIEAPLMNSNCHFCCKLN